MNPKSVSIALLVVWLLTSVVVRVALHQRSTGSLGIAPVTARAGSVEWVATVLFVVSLVAASMGLFVAGGGSKWSAHAIVGGALATVGVLATFTSQSSMGRSWRIGVNPTERTALRTEGVFTIVRNPIFTAMTLTLVGLSVLSLHPLAFIGTVLFVVSIELQVRCIEEPYLAATHGADFRNYASKVGRFIPGVGRRTATGPTR